VIQALVEWGRGSGFDQRADDTLNAGANAISLLEWKRLVLWRQHQPGHLKAERQAPRYGATALE
jgi:hypothetical protein